MRQAEMQLWPLRRAPELVLEFWKHHGDAPVVPSTLSGHRNTCISWMLSSSLASTFFSTPSPRSKASSVVLSEVNPSFFRGSSTSEIQGQRSRVRPLETGTGEMALEGARNQSSGVGLRAACALSFNWNRTLEVGPALPTPAHHLRDRSQPCLLPQRWQK